MNQKLLEINNLMGRMGLAMLILLRVEMLLMHALNNWIIWI